MGGLTLGSVGGELKATGPPAAGCSAGGELKATGPPAAGGSAGDELKVPGPHAAGGIAGGELKVPGPSAAGGIAGGELKVPGPPAAGGIAAGELKVPGPPAAGGIAGGGEPTLPGPAAGGMIAGGERSAGGSSFGGELKPPRSAGGNSAVELMPPGSAASEFMPAGSAGVSALLRQELSLVDLGSNCSTDCLWCLSENIGSCLVGAIQCDDPLIIVECFVGKFSIMADCFGTGGSAGGEGQLTITGSAGATASELVPGSAGGGSAATARTARLSALLRNELAISDVGINCSDDCIECLTDSIGSCIVDAVVCFNPFELAVCFAEKAMIIVECFRT